jgi:protein phosphatase-4 regulatory subunit 3
LNVRIKVCFKIDDPDYPNAGHVFTKYLSNPNLFQKAAEFQNENLETMIHTVFRYQYLKDVVLARILDDETFALLTYLIRVTQSNIVKALMDDPKLFPSLMKQIEDPSADVLKAVKFIREYCNIVKSTEYAIDYYKMLLNYVSHFYTLLESPTLEIRMVVCEITMSCIESFNFLTKSRIIEHYTKHDAKAKHKNLLYVLIKLFLNEEDSGLRFQYSEMLRSLLGSSAVEDTDLIAINESFFGMFYENSTNQNRIMSPKDDDISYIHTLLSPLTKLKEYQSKTWYWWFI